MYFEGGYPIDSRDVDPWNHCKPSGLMGILQEAAVAAACELHASRPEMMEKYNLFWMLARMWYRLDRPLKWNETLSIRTWHRGGSGASSYRDFDLFVDGKPVGEAVSVWVLADADTHRLARMSKIEEFQGTDGGELCKDKSLSRFKLPQEMAAADHRAMHYSDTDINGHVNNVRYADFICDAIRMDQLGQDFYVSALQVDYLAECMAGETITLFTGEQDGLRYVRGADAAGKSRFEGAVTLTPLDRASAIK
ncbi:MULTISPECIES: acyl-[acyl-carrier-protein] thioesterase [unclassified Flavonifractor]|uniref:acyl-[acyl-carrier-protein] thioesterase n=1 Tax=unclassified Flavonifractor TaxID=2629267 RepID=UPI000B3ACC2F|nr:MULTISPECIES: acyl-ACP thioesterase domain-containing protein [unclassified Flavonifractor]OUN10483.1 acyl-ACP thioesterase [Flavonifractor sp. An9]OUQ60899.1 acyl-ACP thioesterase [Flavonifractor sp. An112]